MGTDGPYIRTVHCGGYFPDCIHLENAIYSREKEKLLYCFTERKGDKIK